MENSLVPSSLDSNRVEQAALPAYTESGNRLRRSRIELGRIGRIFIEHTAVWGDAQPRPRFQRVAGIELGLDELLAKDARDTLLGRMRFTLGLHHLLDDGLEASRLKGRNAFTATVVLRP